MPNNLTLVHSLLLFSTAFIAGSLNAVAGGGSFITFPTLIFTGISPITANATNNTALWIAAMASAGAYRHNLHIPRRQLLILCITSLIGGGIGSVILLYTSADMFKQLLPYLLLSATLIFTFSEPLKMWLQFQSKKSSESQSPPLLILVIAQLAISIYGGFFGAGLGILMLATLSFLGIKNIHTMNAFKSFLGSCINGIAIFPFMFAGLIAWYQAILMAVGGSLGGYLCAHYARRLDPRFVRIFVIVVGFSMTTYFFIRG
ncbi:MULTISPECIES: sulfite exporter TauE/SafE family protein [Aphanizomenonaceae]|uniref:Probable membrane transporter protein n=1 Tax=Dolichospermum heterosporum TAC447 TaxID=747523 RepID=A0ABY5LXI0_9CYAN|nr:MULTISPECIES: sulfite exporter TauE/SafE family protein [Aphanizomenonaceae]MBE9260540.1 sulfite exporter TauE/SafE family protein [Dolichospermum sp. LEGE 00246]UUO15271.1 sulfite exporter TauE/SafE family protein [Dolichospermum heterosporum TAC447]